MESDSTKVLPFMINLVSHVERSGPYSFGRIDFGVDHWEIVNRVFEKFSRIVANSGFLEKFGFRHVSLFVTIIPPDSRRLGLSIQEKKRAKEVLLLSRHYWHEFPKNDESELEQFFSRVTAQAIMAMFKRYGMSSDDLLPHLASEDAVDFDFNVDESSEIRICLKLANDRSLADCLVSNFSMIEILDKSVRDRGLGRFDGSDVFDGYETVFFIGAKGAELLDCCISFLREQKLEPGCYLEFKGGNGDGPTRYDL
ncbi:MAG: hypothetical protein K2X81_25275 [Candidatus Obscuribacterales bacterium]|nr:hypothetical protein [Candidatus Obscuribacterales bacterium]